MSVTSVIGVAPSAALALPNSLGANSAQNSAVRLDRGDRVEPLAARANALGHPFGVGLTLGASAEAGLSGGAAATLSAAVGIFCGRDGSVHPGAVVGGGAFAGAGDRALSAPNVHAPVGVLGAYAGAGIGAFATNAGSAQELAGVARTSSFNIGVGPIKISAQFGSANGTFVGSVSVGPGIGIDASSYPTQSIAKSW